MDWSERFWNTVERTSGCWNWKGYYSKAKDRPWRAYFWLDGKMRSAPRLAWTLANGPIPEDMLVCHRCDNPPCTNPDHLFLGTCKDNATDRQKKGRSKALFEEGHAWRKK